MVSWDYRFVNPVQAHCQWIVDCLKFVEENGSFPQDFLDELKITDKEIWGTEPLDIEEYREALAESIREKPGVIGEVELKQLTNVLQILENDDRNPLRLEVLGVHLAQTEACDLYPEFHADVRLDDTGPVITDGRSMLVAAAIYVVCANRSMCLTQPLMGVIKEWKLHFNKLCKDSVDMNTHLIVRRQVQTRQLNRGVAFMYHMVTEIRKATADDINKTKAAKRSNFQPQDIKEAQMLAFLKKKTGLNVKGAHLSVGLQAVSLGLEVCELIDREDKKIVEEMVARKGEELAEVNRRRLGGPTFMKLPLLKDGVDPWNRTARNLPTSSLLTCFTGEERLTLIKATSAVVRVVSSRKSFEDIAGGQLTAMRTEQCLTRLFSEAQAGTEAAKKVIQRIRNCDDTDMADICLRLVKQADSSPRRVYDIDKLLKSSPPFDKMWCDIDLEIDTQHDEQTANRIHEIEEEQAEEARNDEHRKQALKEQAEKLEELKKQLLDEKTEKYKTELQRVQQVNEEKAALYKEELNATRRSYNESLFGNNLHVASDIDELIAIRTGMPDPPKTNLIFIDGLLDPRI